MIYDKLNNISRYKRFSKWMDTAIDFLETTDLNKLPLGRTEIFEDKVFANAMEANAKEEREGKTNEQKDRRNQGKTDCFMPGTAS